MRKRIEDIRLVVEVMHDCAAKHECAVPVIEMFGKDKIWAKAPSNLNRR
jgi:hypothetical protein